MVILEKYSNFKNEIREVEGLGKAVFSIDDKSRIWHEVASKYKVDESKNFLMISNYAITQKEIDPTLISPIENSAIVLINSMDFNVGDFVYTRENELIKLSKPDTNLIEYKLNEETFEWIEEATDLEKVEYSYISYMDLNNPNDIRKMTSQGIIDSYWEYIDSLEKYIDNTRAGVNPLGNIPLPNEKLVDFFNNRFIVGGRYE